MEGNVSSEISLPHYPEFDWQKIIASYQQQFNDVFNLLAQYPRAQICECEKQVVYTAGKMQLYHYTALGPKLKAPPLLIVFALVNRPYIIDLQADRSLIRPLLEAGLDVYLIDWGYPGLEDADLTLDDYILNYYDQCVDFIRKASQYDAIDLLGICQGGTLSLCYTALFPAKIRKLIPMITAVDFHTSDNTLTALVEHLDVSAMILQYKNLPGSMLNAILFSLKPTAAHWLKYQRMFKEDPNSDKMALFLRMEHWLYDTPDQAGKAFEQYITELYQHNKLIKNQFYINHVLVDLKNITHPVLNIFALRDDIIPPSASECLPQYLGSSDYQQLTFDGGHIGIYTSHKSQQQIPPAIIKWLLQ
jgi:polyhydroxyalkanoate synthase